MLSLVEVMGPYVLDVSGLILGFSQLGILYIAQQTVGLVPSYLLSNISGGLHKIFCLFLYDLGYGSTE